MVSLRLDLPVDTRTEEHATRRFDVLILTWTTTKGVLHGGAFSLLFDMFSMMALGPIARPGYWEYATLV